MSNFILIYGCSNLRIVSNNFAQPEYPNHQESVGTVRIAVETRLASEAFSSYGCWI